MDAWTMSLVIGGAAGVLIGWRPIDGVKLLFFAGSGLLLGVLLAVWGTGQASSTGRDEPLFDVTFEEFFGRTLAIMCVAALVVWAYRQWNNSDEQ